jgi:hypothetical protein
LLVRRLAYSVPRSAFYLLSLPDDPDGVFCDLGVGGEDGQPFDHRLRHDDTVEWIAVVEGKQTTLDYMSEVNGEDGEAQYIDGAIQQCFELVDDPELVQLERRFPGACQTEKQVG